VIYFIQAGEDGPIKIGLTNDLHKRMGALRTGCPFKLRLLATTPGGLLKERALQRTFADDRTHGEWFNPSSALLALIAEIGEPDPDPVIITHLQERDEFGRFGRLAAVAGV
jgi:hypothetical protein